MKVLNDKAIIVGLESIDLDQYPNLKVVGCNCTGTEHLPLEEMEKRGIKLISLKGHTAFLKYITSTSEHTWGLIIALFRNYKKAISNPNFNRDTNKGHTLYGKTLGIIGYGRIGKQVSKVAKAFGMKVITVDDEAKKLPHFLGKLLKESDIVTIHIPLQGNEGFFTKEMFSQMKPTAYLINTSRDKIIEKGALVWAIDNGIISGAGIDFCDDSELVEYAHLHDNLILTNHIGGSTYEDRERTEEFITNQVKRYLDEL